MHAYDEAVSGHMLTGAGNTENFAQQGFLWRTSNVMKSIPMGTLNFDCSLHIVQSQALHFCLSNRLNENFESFTKDYPVRILL